MTKTIGKALCLLLSVGLLIGLLTACGPADDSKQGGSDGPNSGAKSDIESIIHFGRDWPTYADPGVGSSYTCQVAHANLYTPLVFPNIDGTVSPHVATEWSISADNLTYTFKIRNDIKFHSGNTMTAKDVAFSMTRLLTLGEGFSHLYKGTVKTCEAIDETTVVMNLEKTYGPFVSTLTRFYILEEALVMANADKSVTTYGDFGDYGKGWLLTHDAGAGPYKINEFQLDEFLLGEKFDDYFMGWDDNAPKYFKLSNMNDPVAQRTAFSNKQLEISSDSLPQETYDELEKMGGVPVRRASAGGWNIYLNTKVAPTDDVNFRKALAYAFDYDTLRTTILPSSVRATGPVSGVLFGKNKDLPGYEYNLDMARDYLSKSKYANDPNSWVVDMAWCAEVPEQEKISLLFQSSLQQLGITLNITKTPFSVMTANAQTIETTPNASIVQWSPSFFEAGDVFKSRYHSEATGSWEQMEWLLDPVLDEMIDKSLTITDSEARSKAYQEIEAYIYDLCPTIWMCRNDSRYVVQPYIEWPILKYYQENISALVPGGYDLFFHDCKVHVDKK